MQKPELNRSALLTLSVANLGTAIAFALQQANMARIFQSLGADIDQLPILMIAGPITGLLVQPLVGHYSDRTWGRFGRRRPYFMVGAVLAGLALLGMPFAATLLVAAAFLWLLDIALNVTIEPIRAFIGDMVPASQRARGFAYNTMLGCSGAIIGSLAPYVIASAGISNIAPSGGIPASVTLSFVMASLVLVAMVAWTVLRTREDPPEMLGQDEAPEPPHVASGRAGWAWLAGGLVGSIAVFWLQAGWELYILSLGAVAFGIAQLASNQLPPHLALPQILGDLARMPVVMRKLALTHALTWFAMFILWPYTTPIVTQYAFGATDVGSPRYAEGADWVGLLFGAYNAVAAIVSLGALPWLAGKWGAAWTHMACLAVGALSFGMLAMLRGPASLFIPFIGIGIVWASLLTMPYVMLTSVLPPRKLGVYVGVFNLFIVIPQLVAAASLGPVMRRFFPGEPVYAMGIAGAAMGLAALSMLRLVKAGSALTNDQ